ncbi:MAG TPA: glycosyltransferase family 4 protein [Gemmataceae bacterium]|nr:glycosyltransferase family 4 protein [Gemmataceae bacterium]
MQLGWRARVPFPESYGGWNLIRTHGRVFALPPIVDAVDALRTGRLFTHPAALSAATLAEIQSRIDEIGPAEEPTVVGVCQDRDVVRYGGAVHAAPRSAGYVDLAAADDRRRAGVVSGASFEAVEAAVEALSKRAAVEFAGWLPVYSRSGDCGRHPQFNHAAEPPTGYRFVCSAPPRERVQIKQPSLAAKILRTVGRVPSLFTGMIRSVIGLFRGAPHIPFRRRLRVLAALAWFTLTLLRRGVQIGALARFIHSRHLLSQFLLAPHRGLVFLTSMPYTFGQNPWVIEIEDPTTLFYPLIQNGRTSDLRIEDSPYLPIVKALLEADECKGILTHICSTAELVPTLFGDAIRNKVFYTPLGVPLPARWQRHRDRDGDEIHLLFINSWCQVPENFYVRGGLDILEAFAILRERYPQLRLTLRTALPALDAHYHRIIEAGGVRLIDRFLTPEEMAALHAESHIFLLPAARIHIVSLLQAMSYGLAVVGSDGWGMEEYLHHERNGLVVKGRYGKASWADQTAGILREDYEPMYTPDPEVIEGLVEAVSRLVEDRELRARLGSAARADVETKYTPARWNDGLKAVFDRAVGKTAEVRSERAAVVVAAG